MSVEVFLSVSIVNGQSKEYVLKKVGTKRDKRDCIKAAFLPYTQFKQNSVYFRPGLDYFETWFDLVLDLVGLGSSSIL